VYSLVSEIDYVKVGKRIRSVRKECFLTQDELAAQCGCTRNHLSAVETGECKPSLDLIVKIAAVLDSSVDFFIMDSPHVNTRYIINQQIAPKLEACTSRELTLINRALDEILNYRNALLGAEQEPQTENTDQGAVRVI
jgi:transcriptional regulator with XRE-family HTH domain